VRNKILYPLLIIIIIFVTIELSSYLASRYNLLIFNNPPDIYLKKKDSKIEMYWHEKNIWGAWHKKNFTTRHKKSCFDVEYRTNEIGARDDPFLNLQNQKNIILLGDSFAEGLGIEKNNMFERIVENKIDLNVLNFASSKDFGILQYYIIYKYLAKEYPHDKILISLLINNDFKDNDLDYFKKYNLDKINNRTRLRPYYKKDKSDFTIIYPSNAQKIHENTNVFLKNHFWTSNVLRTIKYLYVSKNIRDEKKLFFINDNISLPKHITDYYYTPIHQQEAGIFFLEKIITENLDKKIYLFSIPLYEDYLSIKKNDIRNEIYWYKKLKKFEYEYNNFNFLDLYDYADDNYNKFFSPNVCDGHWNEKGHKWAGDIISKFILHKKVN